ncbi:MAG: LPS export ABC transporter permease LptG [Pseudomonadota bacterium]
MTLVDRYLARVVLLYSLTVLLVLVALDRVFALIRQLEDVGRGSYTLLDLVVNVGMRAPGSAYEFAATAVLLGSLLGLGSLASGNELAVVRASGMSLARLARPLFITGIAIAIAVFSLGEWVVPRSESYANKLRTEALSKQISLGGESGLWLREDQRYINIKHVLSDLNLRDIAIYSFSDRTLQQTLQAQGATVSENGGWLLTGVQEWRVVGGRIETRAHETYPSPVDLKPDLLHALTVPPDMLPSKDLWENAAYLNANSLEATAFEIAFWSKFSIPLGSVVMVLLALPFVLGPQRQTSGGKRIFIGSLIGIAYLILNKVSNQLGVLVDIPAPIGAFLPLICFLVFVWLGLRKVT